MFEVVFAVAVFAFCVLWGVVFTLVLSAWCDGYFDSMYPDTESQDWHRGLGRVFYRWGVWCEQRGRVKRLRREAVKRERAGLRR